MGIELGNASKGYSQWLYPNGIVGAEGDVVQASVRSKDLILRSHGFHDAILLDVDAFLGQLLPGRRAAYQCVEGVQQSDGKGRARSHAAPGRYIAIVMDFHTTVDLEKSQALPHGRMLYIID